MKTLTEWKQIPMIFTNVVIISKLKLKCDHIKRLITLTGDLLSGFHCIYKYFKMARIFTLKNDV